MEHNPIVCQDMPKWGSKESEAKFGLGFLGFSHASGSQLIKVGIETLQAKQSKGILRWPPQFPPGPKGQAFVQVRVQKSVRYWAPPMTSDVLCSARAFVEEHKKT